MNEVRIVIADDSKVITESLTSTLKLVDGFVVVGTATEGSQAIELVKELQPDVLVLDIHMPSTNGTAILHELRKNGAAVKIVVFTLDTSTAMKRICLHAGADYFLNKFQISELVAICSETLRLKRTDCCGGPGCAS